MKIKIFLLLIVAWQCFGGNTYFSNNGDDVTGDGSIGSPYATITKANTMSPTDGDTLFFERGSSWYGVRFYFNTSSSTPSNPIAVYSYGVGESPIISAGRLLTSATYRWNLSSGGTNEYYITTAAGSNPSLSQESYVWRNNELMVESTVGTLLDYEWDYGDNDGLGYNTLYIRSDNGDPDITGDTIVENQQSNAFYTTSDSNIYVHGIELAHANGDVIRVATAGSGITIDSCKVGYSKQGVAFEGANNCIIKNSKIEGIASSSSYLVSFKTGTYNCGVVSCLIKGSNSYGIWDQSTVNTAPNYAYNNNIIKTNLAGIRVSSSTQTLNTKNNIVIGCGFDSRVPIDNTSSGTLNFANSVALGGMDLDGDITSGVTDGGNNTYVYPKFLKDENTGWVILRKDDYSYPSNDFNEFTDSVAKFCGPTTYMSYYINRADAITADGWNELRGFKTEGHDMGIHSMGHVSLSSVDAFSIQYTGSGATCDLTIDTVSWTISADCSDDADDFTYSLLSDPNDRLGDEGEPRDGLVTTINALTNYTCNVDYSYNYYAKTYCLKGETSIDIKTAPVIAEFDINRFLAEEIDSVKTLLADSLGLDTITMSYPLGQYNDDVIDHIVSYGGIFTASTVTSTSSTLMRKLKMYEISCVGASSAIFSPVEVDSLAAQALGANIATHGGVICVLVHGTSLTPADSLAYMAKVIKDMGSRCRVGSQLDATKWILKNGYYLNDRTFRVPQKDSADYRILPTSAANNKADTTVLSGIPNLFYVDGVRITDASGALVMDSVNIGAFSTSGVSQFTIDTTIVGEGSLDIDPASLSQDSGTYVTYTAAPASGWDFKGFTGGIVSSLLENTEQLSENLTFTVTFDTVPNDPTNLVLKKSGYYKTVLEFNDNSVCEEGYVIQRSINGGGYVTIGVTPPNQEYYVDRHVGPQISVRYRLWGFLRDNVTTIIYSDTEPIDSLPHSRAFGIFENFPATWNIAAETAMWDSLQFQYYFINTGNIAVSMYNSSEIPHYDSYDNLDSAIQYSFSRNIGVYAWTQIFSTKGATVARREEFRDSGYSLIDTLGNIDSIFVNPADSRVRALVLANITNLINGYPYIDGINIDYLRYDNIKYDYGDSSRAEFERHRGAAVPTWPDDCFGIGTLAEEYSLFKDSVIFAFARAIYDTIKTLSPDLPVSFDVFPNVPGVVGPHQNWFSWQDSNCVDIFMPMNYSTSTTSYVRTALHLHDSLQDYYNTPFSGFIGVTSHTGTPVSKDTFYLQMQLTQDSGLQSFSVYGQNTDFTNNFIPYWDSAVGDIELKTIPELPTNIVLDSSEGKYWLIFENVAMNENGYKIEKKESGGEPITVGIVKNYAYSYTDTGVTEGSDVLYRLIPYNYYGEDTTNWYSLSGPVTPDSSTISDTTWTIASGGVKSITITPYPKQEAGSDFTVTVDTLFGSLVDSMVLTWSTSPPQTYTGPFTFQAIGSETVSIEFFISSHAPTITIDPVQNYDTLNQVDTVFITKTGELVQPVPQIYSGGAWYDTTVSGVDSLFYNLTEDKRGDSIRFRVYNDFGADTSAAFYINVFWNPPTVDTDPLAMEDSSGNADTSFIAYTDGDVTASILWQQWSNSVWSILSGQTNDTLIKTLVPSDSGDSIRAIVYDSQYADTSASALITVYFNPVSATTNRSNWSSWSWRNRWLRW